MNSHSNDPWIFTYSGRRVDLYHPQLDQLELVDIAHGLSNLGRWGGHTNRFYSVAQHSVWVSQKCAPEDALLGLFHDAAEAYLGDICRPLKRSHGFETYCEAERLLQSLILHKFCNRSKLTESVRHADEIALATEAEQLMGRAMRSNADGWMIDVSAKPDPNELSPVGPEVARQAFLLRYYRLLNLNDTHPL